MKKKNTLTPDQFRAIRLRLGLTQNGLAKQLGVSRRAVISYEMGDRPILRHTDLALRFLLVSQMGEYELPRPVRRAAA